MDLFVLFLLLAFCQSCMCASSNYYSLSSSEYQALHDLYVATNGDDWLWYTPYSKYGYPWNFDAIPEQNPCDKDHMWQGITCSSSCGSQPCNITELFLEDMGLFGKFRCSISM